MSVSGHCRTFLALQAVLVFLAVSSSAAMAGEPTGPQVILVRGILDSLSTGLDDIASDLNDIGIPARAVTRSNPAQRAKAIALAYQASRKNRPVVLVGHSFGADEMIRTAAILEEEGIPVSLLLTFDPTIKGPVPKNVRRAVNLHTADGRMWSPIEAVPGYKGTLVNRNVRSGKDKIPDIGHFNMDESPALQAIAMKEIRAALRRK